MASDTQHMRKWLVSERDGTLLAVYTRGREVKVGGKTRYRVAIARVRGIVDGEIGTKGKWVCAHPTVNRMVWRRAVPLTAEAEQIAAAVVKYLGGLSGVLVREVTCMKGVAY